MVVYCSTSIVGAYLSATLSGTYNTALGVPPVEAFLGGFFMLFGSRLAAGCTSGHGISGCPLLIVYSWLAIPPMFGGGIIFSLIWDAIEPGTAFGLDGQGWW